MELVFDESGKVEIKKHLILADNNVVRYCPNQDLSDFYERSSHILDDNFLSDCFESFCFSKLTQYLVAYKGKDIVGRFYKRFFPNQYVKKYLYNSYQTKQLLFMLHTLRSEQNRETAIGGLSALMKYNSN